MEIKRLNINILTPSEIIKKYNLITKKSFGQNFLTNLELLDKIVSNCDFVEDKNILEIGTGPCGLTNAILKRKPKKLITVDMDERCTNIAKNELCKYYDNLEVICEDALLVDENQLFSGEKFSIIANLPYNVGTTLLFKWLETSIQNIEQIVLLLQKEVVDRIVANTNTKDYGRVSVLCQYLCSVKKCFDIKPTAFYPPPKVMSSVVKLTIKEVDFDIIIKLSELIKVSFAKKRKTLINNLKSKIINIKDIINKIGLKENIRAEEVSIDKFLLILHLSKL